MHANEFKKKYPDFAGYRHDFSDPSDIPTDAGVARQLRNDLPNERRIELYHEFIPAIERILPNLEKEWEVFGEVVNRSFTDEAAARGWLESVLSASREELGRLEEKKGGRPAGD